MKNKTKKSTKRILLATLLLTVGLFSANAQQMWTLQQCIDYAMEHNLNVRQCQITQQQADNTYRSNRLAWVPSVSAGLNENFYVGRSMSADNTYVSQNSSNTSVSASMSLPLFSGLSIYRQTQAAKFSMQAAMQDLKAAQEQVSLNIMSAYMQILFDKENVKMAEEQVKQAREQVDKTRILFEAGKVAESEVYESSAQAATYANSLTEADNALMLDLVSLAQLLQLPNAEDFDVVAPEQFNTIDSLPLTDLQNITNYALQNNPQMLAAQLRLSQSQYNLKNAYTAFIPSLNFTTGYGSGYYYYFNSPINQTLKNQFRNNGSLMFGIQLSIPIWDISRYYNIKNAQLEVENQKIAIESSGNALRKEIQTAYYNAVAARQKYLSESDNFKASQLAYQYAQIKFDAGKSTAYEVNESRLRYYKSESSLLQSKYRYLFSNKILDFYGGKEWGKLPSVGNEAHP